MPYEGDDIFRIHEELRNKRQHELFLWRELARLFRPDDNEFDNEKRQQRDDYDIFDSSPIYAQDDFAKQLFVQSTNPVNRWFELGIDDTELSQFKPVREFLVNRTNRMFQSLAPDLSRFYPMARPWFGSVGTFGFGVMYQDEIVGEGTINDQCLPIGQCFLEVDGYGRHNRVHREFSLTGRQFKGMFPESAALVLQDERSYSVIHAVYPNYDRDPEKIGPKSARYLSCYVSTDVKDFKREKHFYELPFHIPVWNERAGKAYPTGPGHNARQDASSLQEIERSNLVAAQFNAEPPVLTTKESGFTAADISPNAVLEGGMEAGKRTVDVLERKQKINLSGAISEQKRAAIKEAFYFTMMQLINRPQMTATEFNGFKEAELERLAPNLVNVQGGLSTHITRRYSIMERAGAFDDIPPPPELVNRRLIVKYISPLAKAQRMAQARAAINFGNTFVTMSANAQRPELLDKIDFDELIDVAHDGMISGVATLIKDQREVAAIRQARAQQMEKDAELQRAAQQVTIEAEASHAQQAASLAQERRRPQ